MTDKRIPRPGEFYKHFKNKLYQVLTVATHSETGEKMVVYQALYGDFETYIRPLDMFISEVEHDKYPEVLQTYRFELVDKDDEQTIPLKVNLVQRETDNGKSDIAYEEIIPTDDGKVNSILLDFLDANSYQEKLNILISKKKYMDDKLLNDMAASLDCTVEDGEIEGRIQGLVFCLQTLARFEINRLR